MSDIVRKRRRWPWMVLAVLILFVGLPIAWQFRPLNASERKLVGTWRTSDGDKVTFKSDRTVDPTELDEFVTTWSASTSHIYFGVSPQSWDALQTTWLILTSGEKLSGGAAYFLDDRGRLHLLPTQNIPEGNTWERVE